MNDKNKAGIGAGEVEAAEIVYRWRAMDYSGYCYGSNPPDNLPDRCCLKAFYAEPDYALAALHEIAHSKNLTATPQQFADHLQREAKRTLASRTAAPQPEAGMDVEAPRISVVEALAELADLVDANREGEYKIDSFTTQPARIALARQLSEAQVPDAVTLDDVLAVREEHVASVDFCCGLVEGWNKCREAMLSASAPASPAEEEE